MSYQVSPSVYIDTAVDDAAAVLQRMGGARAILATAPSGDVIGPLVTGLAARGKLIVVGVPNDEISLNAFPLVFGGRSIYGSLTGTAIDGRVPREEARAARRRKAAQRREQASRTPSHTTSAWDIRTRRTKNPAKEQRGRWHSSIRFIVWDRWELKPKFRITITTPGVGRLRSLMRSNYSGKHRGGGSTAWWSR